MSYDEDPLAASSAPSALAGSPPVGTKVRMVLEGSASKRDHMDYQTKKVKTWPSGDPIKEIVVTGEVDGERKSFYARDLVKTRFPGSLKDALIQARQQAGEPFARGGVLEVEVIDSKVEGGFPRHFYKAKYTPPTGSPYVSTSTAPQPVAASAGPAVAADTNDDFE